MFTNLTDWVSSGKPIASGIIILIGIVLWLIIRKAFNSVIKMTEERDGRKNQTLRTTKNIVKLCVVVVVILALFQANGINVTTLITSLGIAGAVIGFAAQEALKDIFMGIHITSDDFFKVGDVIKFRDYTGEVQKFTLRTTRIEDIRTHSIISISNRNLDVVEVISRLVDLKLNLPYYVNHKEIHAALQEITENLPKVVEGVESSVYKGTSDFNDSSVTYIIGIYVDPQNMPQLRRDALMEIQKELAERGIEFPYPQVDVHMVE